MDIALKLKPRFFKDVYDKIYVPYIDRPGNIDYIRANLADWVVQANGGYMIVPPHAEPPTPSVWYHGFEVGSISSIVKRGIFAPVYVSQDPRVAAFFGFLWSWGTYSAVAVVDRAFVSEVQEDSWYCEKASEVMEEPADCTALGFFTKSAVELFHGKLWQTQLSIPVDGIMEIWAEEKEHFEPYEKEVQYTDE